MPAPSFHFPHISPQSFPEALRHAEPARNWRAEWNVKGTPVHLHITDSRVDLLHSETGDTLADAYPEPVRQAADLLPGTVIEATMVDTPDGPLCVATDCLAVQNVPLDTMPLYARLQQLLPIVGSADLPGFRCSEPLSLAHWRDLDACRHQIPKEADGILLRRLHDTRQNATVFLAR